MFSCETPTAFFVPSHTVSFTSFQVWLLLWVCGWAREREEKVGKVQNNEWAERRMVSREGGLQCGVARQAEEEEADCRAGVALHRRGPLIKSEGQTWELTQASAAASQRRRRGGSLTTPPSPSGRPACWPQRGMGGGQGAGSSSGSLCRLLKRGFAVRPETLNRRIRCFCFFSLPPCRSHGFLKADRSVCTRLLYIWTSE